MLTLDIPTGPVWLDLPRNVRVQVRPITSAMLEASRYEAARLALGEMQRADEADAAGVETDPLAWNGRNASALEGMVRSKQTEALARYGIIAWEGIAGADGAPLPVTPAACVMLAQHPVFGLAFREAYLAPLAAVSAEGNGSAISANGGGAEVANTAEDAPTAP